MTNPAAISERDNGVCSNSANARHTTLSASDSCLDSCLDFDCDPDCNSGRKPATALARAIAV